MSLALQTDSLLSEPPEKPKVLGTEEKAGKTLCASKTFHSDSAFWYLLSHLPEKAMATHSSVLAWRLPVMGEPGGLPSMGSYRVGHD